jgi:hypothetical protein
VAKVDNEVRLMSRGWLLTAAVVSPNRASPIIQLLVVSVFRSVCVRGFITISIIQTI